MQNLTFPFVLQQLKAVAFLFLIGLVLGAIAGFILYNFGIDFYSFIISSWSQRLLFGMRILGEKYSTLWFIANNTMALFIIVFALVMIVTHISKDPVRGVNKFREFEKERPKITVVGLYMLPVGALLINSFLVSLFVTYVYLTRGFDSFFTALSFIVPHGINEIAALFMASSLALAYVKILSKLIMKKKWYMVKDTAKNLVESRVSLTFFIIIAILIVFSGFVEGILASFV